MTRPLRKKSLVTRKTRLLLASWNRRLFPLPKELPHRQVVPAEGDVGQNKSLQNKKPMAVGLPLVRAQRERSRRQQGLPAEFSLK